MKKTMLMMAIAALALASCTKNDAVNTQTVGLKMINLVTSPDGKSKISNGEYNFTIDYVGQTIATECSSLQAQGNVLTFALEAARYDAYFLSNGLSKMVYKSAGGHVSGSALEITDFQGTLTDALVINTTWDGYRPTRGTSAAILSYMVGDESVRTFPSIAYYSGKSALKPADASKETVTGSHIYLFVKVDALTSKAQVKLINVRLEENGAYHAYDIAGVPLTPSASGYTIAGTDLEAETSGASGNVLKVSNLTLYTLSADLTRIILECTIQGVGEISFQGSYTLGQDSE